MEDDSQADHIALDFGMASIMRTRIRPVWGIGESFLGLYMWNEEGGNFIERLEDPPGKEEMPE